MEIFNSLCNSVTEVLGLILENSQTYLNGAGITDHIFNDFVIEIETFRDELVADPASNISILCEIVNKLTMNKEKIKEQKIFIYEKFFVVLKISSMIYQEVYNLSGTDVDKSKFKLSQVSSIGNYVGCFGHKNQNDFENSILYLDFSCPDWHESINLLPGIETLLVIFLSLFLAAPNRKKFIVHKKTTAECVNVFETFFHKNLLTISFLCF